MTEHAALLIDAMTRTFLEFEHVRGVCPQLLLVNDEPSFIAALMVRDRLDGIAIQRIDNRGHYTEWAWSTMQTPYEAPNWHHLAVSVEMQKLLGDVGETVA